MTFEAPATREAEVAKGDMQILVSPFFETALTVLFAAATVLFVSFIAVISGLV